MVRWSSNEDYQADVCQADWCQKLQAFDPAWNLDANAQSRIVLPQIECNPYINVRLHPPQLVLHNVE